jgi:hypothetical protein
MQARAARARFLALDCLPAKFLLASYFSLPTRFGIDRLWKIVSLQCCFDLPAAIFQPSQLQLLGNAAKAASPACDEVSLVSTPYCLILNILGRWDLVELG